MLTERWRFLLRYNMSQEELIKYIEGNTTELENEAVVRWLDEDSDNMQEFLLLRKVYDSLLWFDDNPANLSLKKSINELNVTIKGSKLRLAKIFISYAAVFIVAILCYEFYHRQIPSEDLFLLKKVISPEGQRTELDLSDGSKVWLNANSKITFPENTSDTTRLVELDGEAYFQVAHNPNKRFIVQTSDHQIKVYGTEFNVTAYDGQDYFETALIEGSVEVVSRVNQQKTMLIPNQKLSVENGLTKIESIDDMDQFLWKDGIISFNNESVAQILEKIELYYDVKFDVKNQNILTNRYTGKFRMKDGVEHLLKTLQLDSKFTYTMMSKNNKNFIIID